MSRIAGALGRGEQPSARVPCLAATLHTRVASAARHVWPLVQLLMRDPSDGNGWRTKVVLIVSRVWPRYNQPDTHSSPFCSLPQLLLSRPYHKREGTERRKARAACGPSLADVGARGQCEFTRGLIDVGCNLKAPPAFFALSDQIAFLAHSPASLSSILYCMLSPPILINFR